MPGNVFLIGMPASGKSTVGRRLAKALGLPFKDTDGEIEARAGADVAWIFDVEGEEGFRDREEAVLDELTQADGVVLATGGGAILREANRRRLRERGAVVYLNAPVERLLARVRHDGRRPLLKVGDREAAFRRLDAERAALYRETAHIDVCVAAGSARAVSEDVVARLRALGR